MRADVDSADAGAPGNSLSLDSALALINSRASEWGPDAAGDRPAKLIRPLLPAGTSNHSFLVQAGEQYLVLRIDGIDPARNAIDRQTEFDLQAAAAAAGLAPRPRFCDARSGVLLVDYLPPDTAAAHSPADIGELLRRIHRLDVPAPPLCLGERLRHYENLTRLSGNAAENELVDALSRPMQAACRSLECEGDASVVCHNDLTPENRLYCRGRLFAIDWEYAARGNRWFDLAVAGACDLRETRLLEAYLQRLPTASERDCLAGARLIARYLELLWMRCNTDVPTQTLQAGLRSLQAREATAARDHWQNAF